MYKKSFLSLSFSSKRLQAAQLNASLTGVSKLASADIPPGLIVNHKVADVAKLGSFIKDFLKKNNINERQVGIVVPEFSTFTKTIKLPTLETHELDEAIRWQSQEFLPIPIDQIVLDWKIINRSETEAECLVVAIPQEVLSGFVEAASLAKLYPLLVETPSISLARLGNNPDTRMILYGALGEVITVVTKGEKIVGTVVTPSTDTSSIIQTALSMKARFSDLDIKSLWIGGSEIAQEVYTQLSQILKLQVGWLSVPLKDIEPIQIQEYLIPLSTQLKNPSEPASEETINLLPPKWVAQYEQKRSRVQIGGLALFATFVLASTLAATIAVTLMLSSQIAAYKSITESFDISSEEEAEIKAINEVTDRVVKISEVSFLPQTVINAVNSAAPPSVRLSNYILDFEQGRVILAGTAGTRLDVVSFKQKLEENPDFGSVTIPISSLQAEQDVKFELSFLYNPAVPKKATKAKKLKTN